MKVLLVNTVSLEKNGISTFIINSAEILSNNGLSVTILVPNLVDDTLKNELKQNKIQLKQITDRKKHPIHYINELKNFLKKEKFDVIHVNGNSTTMALELWIAKLTKIKLRIAHSHNTTTRHPLINTMLRLFFETSVNGRLACNDAAGKWLFKNKKFYVLKNGININKYKFNQNNRTQIRKKFNIKSDDILLGNVGLFNYQKNQSFLIKLLKDLKPKYKLMLIGNGDNYQKLKEIAKELNVQDRVIFTGTINNVFDYLNAMDVFLLPSRYEGQPFVLIEAAASGLKCIVSDTVSKEVDITKSDTFCSISEPDNWINAIVHSENLNKLRYITSETNQKILRKKGYDVSTNSKKLIKIYNVMKGKH